MPRSKEKKSSSSSSSSSSQPTLLKSKSRLLTPKERGWTNELENALHLDEDDLRSSLTDYELVCHSIIAKDDTELAIHRIRRYIKFKSTYNVSNKDITVFQAIQIIHKFLHAYPNFIQCIGIDGYHRPLLWFQLSDLTSSPPFNHTEQDRFQALYYIFHALQSDLDAVRNGTVWIGDLKDVTRHNFSLELFNGGRLLMKDSYPIKVKDFPCLNTPSKWSAVYAMCYPFFSTKLKQKYISCSVEQIKDHFPKPLRSPTYGGTMTSQQIIETIESNLKQRFDNEENFRLS